MKIIDISAIQILDSRGNPTIEVEVVLEDGSKGTFRVPSGASTGVHEACELRDGNKNIYHGKSVKKAVENVLEIKDQLVDKDFNQRSLDDFLIRIDGTENKRLLGANAILGISVAFSKACAKYYNLPLYEYLYRLVNDISFTNKTLHQFENVGLFANIINGGLHAGNDLNIQEFMIVPNLENVSNKIRAIVEIYHTLKDLVDVKYGKSSTSVGDEGGFAPSIGKSFEALDLIVEAIKKAGYEGQVGIALDAAASDFYDVDSKFYEVEKKVKYNYKELTNYYNKLIEKYPIISVEDPMAEDDFEGFTYYMQNVLTLKKANFLTNKKKVMCVGDDLLVTSPNRIKMAIEGGLCDSLLLKINQIGTLSESIDAFKLAKSKNWQVIVSHRSGETSDDFIADLAVALESSIKIGAPARGERVAKYNRLLKIFK